MQSFRGPGLEEGLRILEKIKKETGVPVLTDVHEAVDVPAVAEAVDVVQIPAFLCRQTDMLVAAGKHAKAINIKKGPVCFAVGHAARGGEGARVRQ